MSTVRVAHRI
jgi:hypothetical protein